MAYKPDKYQQVAIEQIISTDRTPVVVSARAGSGKTGTMVNAYVRLVTEAGKRRKPVHPLRIFMTTFSNKAAGEMRDRLDAALNGRSLPKHVPIGTSHSLALRVLREQDARYWSMDKCVDTAGIKSNIPSQRNLIWAILGWGRIRWLGGKKGLNIPEEIESGDYLTAIGWLVGRGYHPEHPDAASIIRRRYADLPDLHAAWTMYEQAKHNLGAWDFNDALVRFNALLDIDGLDMRWPSYVFVDEAQDNNVVQFEIAKKLAAKRGKLVLFGDYWQAIYSWRGAQPELFRDAAQTLGGVETPLSTNYRSSTKIVAMSVDISSEIAEPREHATPGEVLLLHSGEEGVAEGGGASSAAAQVIVSTIQAELKRGFEPKDIAVLLRTNALLAPVEVLLHRAEIPVQVRGRTFWARQEVQTFVSYATLLEKPTYNALAAVINRPKRYLGRAFVDDLWHNAQGRPLPDAIRATNTAGTPLSGNQIRTKNEFAQWLDTLSRKSWQQQAQDIADLILHPLLTTDPSSSTTQRVQESMDVLLGMAKKSPSPRVFASTAKNAEARSKQKYDKDENAVLLMTCHAAKGLEWPIVILNVSAEVFPAPQAEEGSEEWQEEKRLLYVAVTRAKSKLFAVADPPGPFAEFFEKYAPNDNEADDVASTLRLTAGEPNTTIPAPRQVLPFPDRTRDS